MTNHIKKPLIYFQFDKEDFYKYQYDKGYFDYEKDGFGDVIVNIDEVVEKIKLYLENNFKLEQIYEKRINDTFAYTDKENSKRVVELIKKI